MSDWGPKTHLKMSLDTFGLILPEKELRTRKQSKLIELNHLWPKWEVSYATADSPFYHLKMSDSKRSFYLFTSLRLEAPVHVTRAGIIEINRKQEINRRFVNLVCCKSCHRPPPPPTFVLLTQMR